MRKYLLLTFFICINCIARNGLTCHSAGLGYPYDRCPAGTVTGGVAVGQVAHDVV